MSKIPIGTVVVSLAALAIGLWLRLSEFYYLQQRSLGILLVSVFALAFVSLMHVLWRRRRYRAQNSVVSAVVLAVTGSLLLVCSFESEQANVRKNNAYLARLAAIVIEYEQVNGQIPEAFERALQASAQTLPNRGDADGNPTFFERTGDHSFVIRSTLRNDIFAEYRDGQLLTGHSKPR